MPLRRESERLTTELRSGRLQSRSGPDAEDSIWLWPSDRPESLLVNSRRSQSTCAHSVPDLRIWHMGEPRLFHVNRVGGCAIALDRLPSLSSLASEG